MTNTHTTAHIPDEAVQAAKSKLSRICKKTYLSDDQMKSVLAAALPHLSSPCAVGVKELDWFRPESTHEDVTILRADTVFGKYYAWGGGRAEFNDKEINTERGTIETAKAAAQADFERRILSCLATKPVDVAAVRRQALEEGFENGVEQSLNVLDAYDDITRNEAEQGIRKLKPDYRALSAEPVQGCGSE